MVGPRPLARRSETTDPLLWWFSSFIEPVTCTPVSLHHWADDVHVAFMAGRHHLVVGWLARRLVVGYLAQTEKWFG